MNTKQFQALTALLQAVLATQNNTKTPAKQASKVSSYKPANKHQNVKAKADKVLSEGMTERQIKNDVLVAKAFARQGITVIPRVNALTYKAWLSNEMCVIPGQQGTWVKGVGTLFHSGQVASDVKISKAQMTAETAHIGQ